MKSVIKKILKIILPKSVILWIKRTRFSRKLKQVQQNHEQALKRVREKDKIKVAFFLIHASIWKYDGLYKLMEQDARFDPVVIICPYIVYGRDTMLADMKSAIEFCKRKGYTAISTYDEVNDTWLDVRKEIQPDIVFFTNPHKLTRDEYYIHNFEDVLTCYTPYAFVIIHNLWLHYGQLFHQLLWRHFVETEIHKDFAASYYLGEQHSVVVSGFPGLDKIFEKTYRPANVWRNNNPAIKRIIWAPHHTIDGQDAGLAYSNFLEYAYFFIELANKYSESMQFAFKPHPLLKPKLYKDINWGKEKTDAYYNKWVTLPNGQLEEGDYIDLFITSDAMIMDSASFMVEYLYVKKPVMFMMRDGDIPNRFNEFGKTVFKYLYHGKTNSDIVDFLDDVCGGKDPMEKERNQFFETVVLPKGNQTATENIYNELIKELC